MKAVCWYGKQDVRVVEVPEPSVINPRDAIIKVTSTAICGSDLHLYNGNIPTMRSGDILGHEFMGEVVDVGPNVKNLKVGDRVVVPFDIACGNCFYCTRSLFALCDNSNPNAWMAEKLYGQSTAGLFGYSHLMGGYAGGQAEYVRVPFADVGPVVVPNNVADDQVLFLGDILPTAFMAVSECNIQKGDTVAIWGCGPVGLLALMCARVLGAEQVIGIDKVPVRLEMARALANADEVLDFERDDVLGALQLATGGRGPDVCIDAVGLEADGHGVLAAYDRVKHAMMLETDRPTALRQIIQACRKGGMVSIPGVYGGVVDKFPLGAAFNKGLTIRGGQTHVQRYTRNLLEQVLQGGIDPSFVITHKLPLEKAPEAYQIFNDKTDDCVKVVLKPS